MILTRVLLTFALVRPLSAEAHLLGDGGEFSPWHVDPVAVALLVLTAWIYWRGRGKPGSVKRRRYFWLGWAVLAIALASPVDPLGEVLFSVHMVQHELIMLVAAPLLVLSRPSGELLRGVSMPIARLFGGAIRAVAVRGGGSLLISPPIAWLVHALGLWGWHLPSLFEASLTNTWIHALQHLSFVAIALIFWFSLIRPRRVDNTAAVLYFFTTAIHASLLGALLTFSPEVWYTPYLATAPEWGLSALEDQQLGGLIMWMPAGVVFVVAGLVSLARTLRDSEANPAHYNLNRKR